MVTLKSVTLEPVADHQKEWRHESNVHPDNAASLVKTHETKQYITATGTIYSQA